MKVKVVRAFLHKGEVQSVGTVLDLPDALAAELRQVGKVQPVSDKPAAARGPMKAASSALVSGANVNAGAAAQQPATTKDPAS